MTHTTIGAWKSKGTYFTYNAYRIFYIQEGQGELLLILHGYPYSSFEWSTVFEEFVKRYRVVVLDLLGMGFSDKPQGHAYSFEEHAEIVNGLLGHLGIAEAHVIGHDLGVSIAQELLARDTEQHNNFTLQSVTFMNGGLFMDVYKPRPIQRLLSQSPDFIGKFISKIITKGITNRSVRKLFGPKTQPEDAFLDQQWVILNYNDGKSIAYLIGRLVFDKIRYQSRWISAMQTTKIPLCLINGPYDPNSGTHMAERYYELIPDPKVYVLEDHIGHWPILENPDGVVMAYIHFRAGLPIN